jgi:hypothetical protein
MAFSRQKREGADRPLSLPLIVFLRTGYAASVFLGTPGIQEMNRRHSLFSHTTSKALALQIEL